MKANRAVRFRLYPDRGQAERLASWSHTCRAVWNTALAQRIWAYRSAHHVTLRVVEQCAELTEARREHDWLRDLPAQCAQQVLRQLDAAYDNFWNPAGTQNTPTATPHSHSTSVTEHFTPPDGREPPRAVVMVRRARAVQKGKAPKGSPDA